MILVAEGDNRIVKALPNLEDGLYGFHKIFGFIGEKASIQRMKSRKRRGIQYSTEAWNCLIDVKKDKSNNYEVKAVEGCEVKKVENGKWKLITEKGNFLFSEQLAPMVPGSVTAEDEDYNKRAFNLTKSILTAFVFLMLFAGALDMLTSTEEVVEEEKKEKEQEIVKIKEQKTVNINIVPAKTLTKEQIKQKRVKRAIMANLAFAGLLGSKELKKAVGGAPTELKKVTAGAGAGGDAGSGGEVLVGLGKGVKKITVGNTGVAGLGGVGTKGRGGGQGGYGDTVIASGEGKGISTMPVSNNMALQGGLDKYVIKATLAKYYPQVQACYQKELNKIAGLGGKIRLNFVISAAGRVTRNSVIDHTLGNADVVGCVATRMKTWRFPKPRGGVTVPVNHPIILSPDK
jgi:hypothetical protein